MQLLLQITTPDHATWQTAFDADAEDRRLAGLSQLQIWHDADTPTRAYVLLEVNDRAKAEGWLAKERGLGAQITATFLRTA